MEALLLDAWLASKVAIAESQDYWQDLEAVKVSHSWSLGIPEEKRLSGACKGRVGWEAHGKGGVSGLG